MQCIRMTTPRETLGI